MQAGEDSHRRLKLLHRLLHFVSFAESDVRWIADYKIKSEKFGKVAPLRQAEGRLSARTDVLARDDKMVLIEHGIEDIALQEPHPLTELQPGGIGARDFQRFDREIDGIDFGVGQLVGECQCDAPRPCAYIYQLATPDSARQLQHSLNQSEE